ncbi:MAG: hypothetical protein IJI34_07945, partial [Clostridia bacterium]|nr:hypothetical protein [Clostridia bacterium]
KYPIRLRRVYLSLGDREERTRNPVLATVGTRITEAHGLLRAQGVDCVIAGESALDACGEKIKDRVTV